MSRTTRTLALLGAALAVAVAGFVLLRPSDDGETTATTQATTPSTTTATTTATTTTTPKPRPKPKVIRVEDGRPVGGVKQIEVVQGRTVRLLVRSDSPDEVHVHGYDLEQPVGPDAPARFRFKASSQGRYEIELHGSGTQIARLDVTP